jgi:hypothetical protein
MTKCSSRNIVTTLCGTDTSKVEEGRNDDDDDNDTNILDEEIKAPNDSDYHELQPEHPNFAINHPPRSLIIRASQSHAFRILQFYT